MENRKDVYNLIAASELLPFTAICFSNLLCMTSINNPKIMADTINPVLSNPLTEKDNLIKIVEMIKPEFLITL